MLPFYAAPFGASTPVFRRSGDMAILSIDFIVSEWLKIDAASLYPIGLFSIIDAVLIKYVAQETGLTFIFSPL